MLTQSVRPDRVLLWITRDDLGDLPGEVLALRRSGLEIRAAPELRSFKKIVPTLAAYPDAFIATADDDTFYPHRWLESLVKSYSPDECLIPGGRVHRIVVNEDGAPVRYTAWRHDIRERQPSSLNFATGVGGVLFPPHSLHADAARCDLFMRLCPTSDDAWLYWMARRAGWMFKLAEPTFRYRSWPGTQDCALRLRNAGPWGDNDRQIANLQRCLPLADFQPRGAPTSGRPGALAGTLDEERC